MRYTIHHRHVHIDGGVMEGVTNLRQFEGDWMWEGSLAYEQRQDGERGRVYQIQSTRWVDVTCGPRLCHPWLVHNV